MDFETFVERVKSETHRRAPEDEIYAARGAESVIRFFRRERFWFNEWVDEGLKLVQGSTQMTRATSDTPGDNEYFQDLLRVIALRQRKDGSTDAWSKPLTPYSISQEPSMVATWDPRFYTMIGDAIQILPETREDKEIKIAYVRDLGQPRVKVDDQGIWQIWINGALVSKDFTNAWFTEALDLLVNKACFDLFMGPYSNEEKAKRYSTLTQDSYQSLKKHGNTSEEVGDAVPWGQELYDLPGSYGIATYGLDR